MKRILYIIAWLISVLFAAIVLTVFGLYWLTRPSFQVIQTWKQPADIQYTDGLTHYLSVVEGDRDWRGFPVHVSRRYFVYVGLESGTPTYGHEVDFSFYPGDLDPTEDTESVIKQSTVEWSPEGVTLQTISGHRLFIPARMFVGGR